MKNSYTRKMIIADAWKLNKGDTHSLPVHSESKDGLFPLHPLKMFKVYSKDTQVYRKRPLISVFSNGKKLRYNWHIILYKFKVYNVLICYGSTLIPVIIRATCSLIFMYLFLTVLDLRGFAWVFSSCGKQGLLFSMVSRLLITVASLVVEHGLQGAQASVVTAFRLRSYATQAQLLHSARAVPRTGIEPVSPTLAGWFFSTVPPEEPALWYFLLSSDTHSLLGW